MTNDATEAPALTPSPEFSCGRSIFPGGCAGLPS
jgi:hypothetical protein